jgi:hypothetical protein
MYDYFLSPGVTIILSFIAGVVTTLFFTALFFGGDQN